MSLGDTQITSILYMQGEHEGDQLPRGSPIWGNAKVPAEVITGNQAKAGLNRPDNWRQEDYVGKLTMRLGPCLIVSG